MNFPFYYSNYQMREHKRLAVYGVFRMLQRINLLRKNDNQVDMATYYGTNLLRFYDVIDNLISNNQPGGMNDRLDKIR